MLQYLTYLMQDAIELSLNTARKAHTVVLQDMEKGKINWEQLNLVEQVKNSIRDARTPQHVEIVFNTMRYRGSETVHRLGYFQSSVSPQIMFE